MQQFEFVGDMQIFYANNATNISAETAQAVSWVCSLTSVDVLNVTDIDNGTFDRLVRR